MRIGKITAKAIIECVEAIEHLSSDPKKSVTSEKVHEHLRMSFEYVNDAIEVAIIMKLIRNGNNLTLSADGKKLSKSTTKQSRIIFRKILTKTPPTQQLIELIQDGKKLEEAIKSITKQFEIQGNEKEISYSFRNLMIFANIIGPKGAIINLDNDT